MATGDTIRIALAGDVMIGRGVDQIMRHPGDPRLHEGWARSAERYVELAEARAGTLPRGVDPTYIWGDTLARLGDHGVEVRIVNLETAVTARGTPWPGKGIHYRVHPENADCLTAGGVDAVTIANNHVLDWSEPGLVDTVETLDEMNVRRTGAGRHHAEAWRPAYVSAQPSGRVVVLGVGASSSGIERDWSAGRDRSGVALLESLSESSVRDLAEALESHAPGDVVVVSIHWGANWGYRVSRSHRRFARALIDDADVDIVHGHSSHHPLGFEVYRDRLILYGCGDLLTDYEGIGGHEEFRPELGAWYVADLDSVSGALRGFRMIPTKTHRFSLTTPDPEELDWLSRRLEEESLTSGVHVRVRDEMLIVDW